MGVVYEVEHVHTGQRLALKLLSLQPGASIERFKREARAASRIQSDHIVRVTDADVATELGGAPFLVMELLEGANLESATGGRPASAEEVIEWLRQVARALGKAHDAGIVHRDLKPENLFLTKREDGSPLVKILDFGIAKMAVEGTALTASDAFLGTPGYMAPEQTDSRGPPVTFKADLFALGLIAFKLLIGRVYWNSGSLAQLLAQILAEPMPPPSERGSRLGPRFDAWFARACDRDPAKRFRSAREQVEALAETLGLPLESAPTSSSETSPSPVLSSSTSETAPASSLNGSISDLVKTQRRLARTSLLGGGIFAAAGTVVVVLMIARSPRPKYVQPAADTARPVVVAGPAADSVAPAIVPAAPAFASAAPLDASPLAPPAALRPPALRTPQHPMPALSASAAPAAAPAQPSATPEPSPPSSADPLLRLRRL